MPSLIYLAGPQGEKIRRALESTGLTLKYYRLDAARSWQGRARVLWRAVSTTWSERRRAVGFMMDFIGGYSLVTLLACRLAGVPLVVRLRGDIWHESREAFRLAQSFRQRLFQIRQLWLAGFVMRHVDLALPISDFLRRRILAETRLQGAHQMRIITLSEFVDVDHFSPETPRSEARRVFGLADDARVICMVTNFSYVDKARGIYAVLAVLDSLMHADHRIHWLIAGSGRYHAEFAMSALDRAAVKDNIHFLGACSDVRLVYLASDLMVHFSFMDAMPAVVLEAQACGLPVIVNDFGGMPEEVRNAETGYVVNAEDVESVKGLLLRLLDDPDQRYSMGSAARQWVVSRFNHRVVGERFLTALKPVVPLARQI